MTRFIGPLASEHVHPLYDVKSVERIKAYHDPHVMLDGIILLIERGLTTVDFERKLAEMASVETDNKVVYKITTDDDSTFYVKVHDMHLTYALTARSR
jgi:hypothetical protein